MDPLIDTSPDSKLLESAIRADHAALADTSGLSVDQLHLVHDAETLFREGRDGHCSINNEGEDAPGAVGRETTPSGCRSNTLVVMKSAEECVIWHEIVGGELRRLVPFCYSEDRKIEQLHDLPPECSPSADVERQDWADEAG